ncbi:hypothetical protein D6833_00950 [Candidatus Parcubacteria bacterium]|nr:MAG: hypothetical protein D6833_00950 [Candidatus Parcubacteria bacterium]
MRGKQRSNIGNIVAGTLAGLVALATAAGASAAAGRAQVTLSAPKVEIVQGDLVEVQVQLSAPRAVNAYEVELRYPPSLLRVEEIDNSNSLVDVWQSMPVVHQAGSISFRGGSLRPFQGKEGKLFAVRFRALAAGKAVLRIARARVYLANGKGTREDAARGELALALGKAPAPAIAPSPRPDRPLLPVDTAPPQVQYIALVRDVFNPSQKLLSFYVRDDGSGIKKTFVREKKWLFWNKWRQAYNPTPIPSDVWAVAFRTIDNRGNEAAVVLYNWSALFLPQKVALMVLLLALFLWGIGWARRMRREAE